MYSIMFAPIELNTENSSELLKLYMFREGKYIYRFIRFFHMKNKVNLVGRITPCVLQVSHHSWLLLRREKTFLMMNSEV